MRDGVLVIKIPRKGGRIKHDYLQDDIQRGRDNAARSLRFERREKRKRRKIDNL
jgi:hypothetical protein